MIQELFIKNIALIDELRIGFKEGLNVLSGETGAGKSIIVDAVNLILGSRADKELIKAGEQSAYAEALISLDEYEALPDALVELGYTERELLFSRELSENGRNVCRINGRMVSLSVLRQAASATIDIYGQNQNQKLLEDQYQLFLIDAFGGKELAEIKQTVAKTYGAYTVVERELEGLTKSAAEKNRMLGLLEYQIGEIERAGLKRGEEEDLLAERTKQLNAEKIALGLETAKNALTGEGGAVKNLYVAIHALEPVSGIHPAYEKIYGALNDAYYAVEDAGYELSGEAEDMVYDEERLNKIEDRLSVIHSLKRKYGNGIDEILGFLQTSKEEYEALSNSEIKISELQKEAGLRLGELREASARLTAARKKYAAAFVSKLKEEMEDLGMKDAALEAEFLSGSLSAGGADEFYLLISVNKGVEPRRLSKIASGGEISRIMLAIKNVSAEKEGVATMIFDEVDTGISGKTAQVVAKKMANISRERQVICVTHLAQIAAMGDANFYIEKREQGGTTRTFVSKLNEEALGREVARLSGGIESKAAIEHARELIENARMVKAAIL